VKPDVTPCDLDAERALLGDLLTLPHRIAEIRDRVAASDFINPDHAAVFGAVQGLHDTGQKVDVYTVAAELRGVVDDPKSLLLGLSKHGAGGFKRYADIVVGHSVRRKVIAVCGEVYEWARADVGDPLDLLDRARGLFSTIDTPTADLPGDFYGFDEFLDRGVEARSPWVVQGLLRRDWRALLVAGEGAGKSVIQRSFALMCASGVHPFAHVEIPKVRTLLVDLENPDDAILGSCLPIREQARRIGRYEPGRAWLWHRPGGINIRSRGDRSTFDAILTAAQPELVCVGPLYKLYRRERNETDEQAAEACQQALDDLRTRHRFGLLVEHHAPKGHAGVREMTPYGSSYWLRWPELGFGLVPENGRLMLKRWRGDRLPSAWPESICRDDAGPWPFVGTWPRGSRYDDHVGAA
jgi:hypothetical protein